MNFAIDGTLWEDDCPDGYDIMAGAILTDLEGLGHRCTYLGRTRILPPSSLNAAIRWAKVERKAEDWLLPSAWNNRAVPRAMLAAQADKWISFTGHSVSGKHLPAPGTGTRSLGTPTQSIFLKGVSDLLWPGPDGLTKAVSNKFNAKWGSLLKEPTAEILLFSAQAATVLKEKFGVPEERLQVLPAYYNTGMNAPSWEDREAVKWGYSNGKEFFFWMGNIDEEGHWKVALKAFSQFKLKLKSQMQMLMAPWKITDPQFRESMASYKYRADVNVLEVGPDTWKRVVRGAYAMLYTPSADTLGWVAHVALSLGVPLISSQQSIAREWAGDLVGWVDPGYPEAIAEAMMRLFKDEPSRALIQEKGLTLSTDRIPADLLKRYEDAFGRGFAMATA